MRRPPLPRWLRPVGAMIALALVAAHLSDYPNSYDALRGPARTLHRGLYSLAVVLLVGVLLKDVKPPCWLRFLSDSTLTIYLYHIFVLAPGMAMLGGQPPVLRIIALVVLMLGVGVLVALGSRRVLGPFRARALFGA